MSSSPDSGLGACSPSNSQIESHGPPQMGQADQQITPSSTGAYARLSSFRAFGDRAIALLLSQLADLSPHLVPVLRKVSMQAWHLDAFKAAKPKLAAAAKADGPLNFDKLKLESACVCARSASAISLSDAADGDTLGFHH